MTETVIDEFRKLQQSELKNSIELELRFQNVTFNIFETIVKSLLKQYKWEVEKTVEHRVSMGSEQPKTNSIEQIEYRGDKRIPGSQFRKKEVIYKTLVSHPVLDYKLTLSIESKDIKFPDKPNSITRIKLRFRFYINEDWQIHTTIVQQLTAAEMNQMQNAVNILFKKHNITPENFTDSKIGLDPTQYKFEIEAELMNPTKNISISDINSISNKIFDIIGTEKTENIRSQNEIYFIAKQIVGDRPEMLEKFRTSLGIKNLAPAVLPLNKPIYKSIYPPVDYFVSDKADGMHAFISIHDQKCHIIADKYYEFSMPEVTRTTILDCELIYETTKEPNTSVKKSAPQYPFRILVFDAIIIDGKFIADKGFEVRKEYFQEGCKIVSSIGINIAPKKFPQILHSDPKHIKEVIIKVTAREGEQKYNIDGLIMVAPGDDYKNTKWYKFKSIEDNTIDFLVMKCPENILGMKPFIKKPDHDLYFLFNGITYDLREKLGLQFCPGYKTIFEKTDFISSDSLNKLTKFEHLHYKEIKSLQNLFPIQFSPSDSPLAYIYYHPKSMESVHEKIAELRCKGPCNAAGGIEQFVDWELVKIRGERLVELANKRYFGNYFKVAEMTWVNYIDPFPIEQIWDGPSGGYFAEEKSGIYFAQTAFTSYVKSKRIEKYQKYKIVFDLGGGRGQDLKRYIVNQIQEVIIIDKDKSALAELDRRKYDILDKLKRGKDLTQFETKVRAMYADLNTNYKDIIARIHRNFPETQKNKAPAVVSHLAIHYCMSNMGELHNYSSLVQLLTDGIFSVICMFGDRVNSLFNENKIETGKSWDSYQGEVKKYSLKKLYNGNALTAIGQKIGVLLPFSHGEYYEEYLVNLDTLSAEFKLRGFKLQSVIGFEEHKESFKHDNPKVYAQLTEEDFKYLSLYGELIFTKA